MQYFQ